MYRGDSRPSARTMCPDVPNRGRPDQNKGHPLEMLLWTYKGGEARCPTKTPKIMNTLLKQIFFYAFSLKSLKNGAMAI